MSNELEKMVLSFEGMAAEDAPLLYTMIAALLAEQFPGTSAQQVDASPIRINAPTLLAEVKKNSNPRQFNVIERFLSGDVRGLSDETGLLPEVILLILGSQTKRDFTIGINVLAKAKLGLEISTFGISPDVLTTMREAVIRLTSE